jgi:hypothetical protein
MDVLMALLMLGLERRPHLFVDQLYGQKKEKISSLAIFP